MFLLQILTILAIFFLPNFSFAKDSYEFEKENCERAPEYHEQILTQVRAKNTEAISYLPECFKLDRKLILKATIIDPSQFQNASEILREDENFIRRLLKVNPEVLKYISPKLRTNKIFMQKATYISRDALQYADPSLLDNILFMRKMISFDSQNYKFASERLREMAEFAAMAFSDDGLLLAYAPDSVKNDKKLVKIALISNSQAFAYASDLLKLDEELEKLSLQKTSIESKPELEKFLQTNYVKKDDGRNIGTVTAGKAKFFRKQQVIGRNYITKWQRNLLLDDEKFKEDFHLITAGSRNYPTLWKEDLKKYPDLVKKIEKFFSRRNVDAIAIKNLSTSYMWKVKNNPLTLAFNLYLLRDTSDIELGPQFANVTSLTAVAQKRGKEWNLSVVEVIFDSEITVDVDYENGHKKYVLWDLYTVNKKDKNPKIIFKVEDKFGETFEVFEEQSGGKYRLIDRYTPKLKVGDNAEKKS